MKTEMGYEKIAFVFAAIGMILLIFAIISWKQKRGILYRYQGVFGRISSFLLFLCVWTVLYQIINMAVIKFFPEIYEKLPVGFAFKNIAVTFIVYGGAGALIFWYVRRKCPTSFRKGLFFAMLRCGTATAIQLMCALFIIIWFVLYYRPRYYTDGTNIYEVVGW